MYASALSVFCGLTFANFIYGAMRNRDREWAIQNSLSQAVALATYLFVTQI